MLSGVTPIRVKKRPEPFDDPEWLFELKHDGFRAVAYVDGPRTRLISRNRHRFDEFEPLASAIERDLAPSKAVLDGEIVCLDGEGRSKFNELMARRASPFFYAFDLLWLNGQDLRELPLFERKAELRKLVPEQGSRLLFVDHVDQRGVALFEEVCRLDLEGIVAKRRRGLYRDGTRWLKIKNSDYSQAEGRGELFDRRIPQKSRPGFRSGEKD